jgi:hypothetical protein
VDGLNISDAELRELFTAIETGSVLLVATKEPKNWGVVEYKADNGWSVAIYNDANEWDYIEWVQAPDGRRVTFDELCKASSEWADYDPDASVAVDRYGLPGTSKCTVCGTRFRYESETIDKCPYCRTQTA